MMKKRGFTLVELLAVISIIAIISLIAVPIISNSLEKGRLDSIKSTANAILDAARIYNADKEYLGFLGGMIDVKGNTLKYENKSQIEYGNVCFDDETTKYSIYIETDSYCAFSEKGIMKSYKKTNSRCASAKPCGVIN